MSELKPLSEVDASFLYLERPGEPWSIHLEIRVSGQLDAERVLDAARVACERHPILRARMLGFRWWDRTYRWEIGTESRSPELTVLEVGDEHALARARERILECAPSLEEAPPFTLGLIKCPDGDALILNLHHAMSDGISAWRLMTSIVRAYAGAEDPVPAFDQLEMSDVHRLIASDTRRRRFAHARKLSTVISEAEPPVRIEPQSSDGTGVGVLSLVFEEREMDELEALRRGAATINDVLVAGLVLAIRRWNAEHDAEPGKIAVMVPANLRPSAWSKEVLGNLASYMSIAIPQTEPSTFDALLDAVALRTQRSKRDHTASAMLDVLGTMLRPLPLGIKLRLKGVVPQTREQLQDTAIMSNLGRLTIPDPGGEAGSISHAWFSPPTPFTRGFAIGALSLCGRLYIALRYHRALFDKEAVVAFAALYRDALLGADYSSTTSVSPSLTA